MYTSTLQFDYLTETDGGNYNCTVQLFNVNGSNSVEIETPDCEYILINCHYDNEVAKSIEP